MRVFDASLLFSFDEEQRDNLFKWVDESRSNGSGFLGGWGPGQPSFDEGVSIEDVPQNLSGRIPIDLCGTIEINSNYKWNDVQCSKHDFRGLCQFKKGGNYKI